jgi:hypothetical protein
MSHKHKSRHKITVQLDDTIESPEPQKVERAPTEVRSTSVSKSDQEEGGFTWQLMLLIGAMVLGLLALLGKTIGLF